MYSKTSKLILLGILCVLAVVLVIVFPTYRRREHKYYSDKHNYITVTATVTDISYHEESNKLYIQVCDKSTSFTDTGFVIAGNSLDRAMQNGITSSLYVGDTITFSCAPRYFGDGYYIPIVAITVGGKVFLNFEDGYAYLLQSYHIDTP